MQPPMIGTWTIQVNSAKPYTIHGDLYYELHGIRTDDPTHSPIVLRLPQHATSAPPIAGQTLEVTFLMGQVTAAKPI
jgi:hypothetical protein